MRTKSGIATGLPPEPSDLRRNWFQNRVDCRSRLAVILTEQVGVHAQRDIGLGVAQAPADRHAEGHFKFASMESHVAWRTLALCRAQMPVQPAITQ
jgi:hypothetical protein